MDCYGSFTDASVAEDGYLEEHSYWVTLFGMKMSASFSLHGLDVEETQSERERENETHHLGLWRGEWVKWDDSGKKNQVKIEQ